MANKKRLFLIFVTIVFQLILVNRVMADEHVWKVSDGVYRYGNPNHGYYSMFIVTDNGVIAIEPMNLAHSEGMLKAIRKVTSQPIRYLLHSHNHWDHSKGGKVFRDQGAKVVAHKEAVEWMKDNPHSDLLLPDEVWNGNRKDITLGETKIELHYLGMNHGLGMTVFLLPKEKIAYIADVVTPNRMPFSIADFNIKELMRTLEELEKMGFTKAIYSHSHAKEPVGGKSDVVQTRAFFMDLQNEIIAEFQKGPVTWPLAQTAG